MTIKAKAEYNKLSDDKSFLGLGSASTHLKLKAGIETEVPKSLLPLPKHIKECITEIKAKEVK